MSSMKIIAKVALFTGAAFAATVAQCQSYPSGSGAYYGSGSAASAVAQWNSLRQSDNMPFSSYANFLRQNRDWPGELALRRAAEKRLSMEPANPSDVLRFFDALPPLTPGGHAQRAFALNTAGRRDEALSAARTAWTSGVLPTTDEARLLGAFRGGLTPADHNRRMDALLSNGDLQSAGRTLPMVSGQWRSLFEARMAFQTRAPDAATRALAAGPDALSDPGFLIDRANWMRNNGGVASARELLAQPRRLRMQPANPEKFMESAVALARGAANDRQWSSAYRIASQVDDLFPAGTDVSERTYGERDEYTNLTWLAGQAAMKLGRPADAMGMFDRYGRAAKSSQTRAKGFYWAARAAAQAGQQDRATRWLEQAASSPDQFYGLLALEKLGRTPPRPAETAPVSAAERAAFARRPLAAALAYLGTSGRRSDQTVFVRALASSLHNNRDRAVAADFGRSIGRPDVAVWVAREARSDGDTFYERAAFPTVTIPAAYSQHWAASHGIIRQESSFDRAAISSANARGMMQLVPGTAQIEARRAGVPYNLSRLTEDASYNVQLGSGHVTDLMSRFGNNLVLVAVAYNAGPGRVPQWIARNGDPRMSGVDVVQWIEDIPFSETRNYVQRVVENAMVYDMLAPNGGRARGRVSYYLGQRSLR